MNNIPIEKRLEQLQKIIIGFCLCNPDIVVEYISMDVNELMMTYRNRDNISQQIDIILENKKVL